MNKNKEYPDKDNYMSQLNKNPFFQLFSRNQNSTKCTEIESDGFVFALVK